jgi:putative ABC transport system permease protein
MTKIGRAPDYSAFNNPNQDINLLSRNMLRNYLLTAIAVLRRRPFFTAISLFGISFTLIILILVSAFVDNVIGPNYPEVHRDRSLYVNYLRQINPKNQYQMTGPGSYYFMDCFVGSLKTPEKIAISSSMGTTNTYINNKKLSISIKYTNDAFWEVLQYDFIEGKPYTRQQIDNAEHVAVISEDTKKAYFGDVPSVVGKFIETDNVKYRITGVVRSVPVTMPISHADVFAPYTVSKSDYRTTSYGGSYTAILLARSASDLPKIKAEYAAVVAKIPPANKDYSVIESTADTYFKSFTILAGGDGASLILFTVLGILVFFIFFLPTLNLVNINISRIMERSSEIGVRKAFGASSRTLVGQFIAENIILTFFGALIGLLLSFIIIQVVNGSDLIANIHLSINFTVLGFALLACLLFGLLSGVYPAWRMSRLHVVTALKA